MGPAVAGRTAARVLGGFSLGSATRRHAARCSSHLAQGEVPLTHFSAIWENIMALHEHDTRSMARRTAAAALFAMGMVSPLAMAADDDTSELQSAWRDEISRTPTPTEGCFQADFPST